MMLSLLNVCQNSSRIVTKLFRRFGLLRKSLSVVASVETAIAQSGVTEDQATRAQRGVIGALSRARLPSRNILPEDMKAVKELTKGEIEEIVILPADKGRATVVMDHSDYSSKLEAMLEDRDMYRPVARDPTAALEHRMNSVLLDLRRAGRLPGNTYYHLHNSAGQVPRLYGLPKVHKQDIPLWPIVSFVSSPTYQLSKFLSSLLSPIVGLSDHHVRNSQHFTQFVITQKLRDTEVLVSFDVVSFFTRVLTTRAIQVTHERLLDDPSLSDRTSLTVEDICSLLKLCLEATHLSFRGKIYQQVHGTDMASPASVVVANLVMEDIEQKALSTFHTPPRSGDVTLMTLVLFFLETLLTPSTATSTASTTTSRRRRSQTNNSPSWTSS